jgi:hypothetical protein
MEKALIISAIIMLKYRKITVGINLIINYNLITKGNLK